MAHWFYKDGKGKVFDKCPEGWTDHPDKKPTPKKKVVKKKVTENKE